MKIYLSGTANLGDFLNAMPVLAGVSKDVAKFDLIIKKEMRKFNGIKEFLMYQDLFTDVSFDDELFVICDRIAVMSRGRLTEPLQVSNTTRETIGVLMAAA